MNIIPVVCNFMSDIFLAAEKFMENPVELSQLEKNLSAIGNRPHGSVSSWKVR